MVRISKRSMASALSALPPVPVASEADGSPYTYTPFTVVNPYQPNELGTEIPTSSPVYQSLEEQDLIPQTLQESESFLKPTIISPKPKKKKCNAKPRSAVPATIPKVYQVEGIDWISFTYSIVIENIPEGFKRANSVYPRAYCDRAEYAGNRWEYETNVNLCGWKLCWVNPDALCGKRGLIQRAVDSFRNRFPEMRSRRVVRQEKLVNGTLRKRADRSSNDFGGMSSTLVDLPYDSLNTHAPKKQKTATLVFETIEQNRAVKHRVNAEIQDVDVDALDTGFKAINTVFHRVVNIPKNEYTFGPPARWEYETTMNDLAYRLAFLNPNELSGNLCLLHRAMDTYRTKHSNPHQKPRAGKRILFESVVSKEIDAMNMNADEISALQAAASGLLAVAATTRAQAGESDEMKSVELQDAAALLNFFTQV